MSFDEKKATLLSAMQAEVGGLLWPVLSGSAGLRESYGLLQAMSSRHRSSPSKSWRLLGSPKVLSHRLGPWNALVVERLWALRALRPRQAVKEVVESLVAEDEVQSDKASPSFAKSPEQKAIPV